MTNPKYEYLVQQTACEHSCHRMTEYLNRKSDEGWDLMQVMDSGIRSEGMYYYFRRPKKELSADTN